MARIYRPMLLLLIFSGIQAVTIAQTIVIGKIIDAATKEPVSGATVHCTQKDCPCACVANDAGEFEMKCMDCRTLFVSYVGYSPQQLNVSNEKNIVSLTRNSTTLDEVVFSANRGEGVKRSDAPIAIAAINTKTIDDTKANTADQLLNKVSGVNMVNLGNEQHQMSIRQPMTTKSLFLYLEDGVPIRTSGLYNHNALLEMNLAAVKNIEVIKGPSSSLYGSEAIGGVVNFITAGPSAMPVVKLSLQGNDIGYRRTDLTASTTKGKWGLLLSGYYANKSNGGLEYTDFHKGILTGKADYRFSDKTLLSGSITYLNYYSDMAGGVDSAMFAGRSFSNPQTFTYRKVSALRYRSSLMHTWNENSKTTVTALYRDNAIGQNPAYRVKDDYHKVNDAYTGKKDLAHGEINENSFNSYSFIAQHRQTLDWKKSVVIGGLSVDFSPSAYTADYIRINKDTLSGKYVSYQNADSTLTDYRTKLNNYAAFLNLEFNPVKRMRVVGSLRYDFFSYGFNNHLMPSAFSGSPDTLNRFRRISPKIGFTYNVHTGMGIYANYSQGFVPPQVTELYTGVKVPDLNASVFYNYEIGGWAQLFRNKVSVDLSLYRLAGTNEIIFVKLDDGSFVNQNAGRTLHRGLEFGMNAFLLPGVQARFSGAYSKHEFVEYVEKGIKYNDNEMPDAPHWVWNGELWYKPLFVQNFRIGAELQRAGNYFVDPQNTAKYDGYYSLNIRSGYKFKGFEVWLNVLNSTNNYYSYITSKSAFGYSYQLAEGRNFNVGVSYEFVKKQNAKSKSK
jgi:iron complex outermembrane recepter protein